MNEITENSCASCNKSTGKSKVRRKTEFNSLMNRLKRIEGQIRGLQRMLENNCYCTDIMLQVSATKSALTSFNNKLLENHLNSCVLNDVQDGNTEKIEELIHILKKIY